MSEPDHGTNGLPMFDPSVNVDTSRAAAASLNRGGRQYNARRIYDLLRDADARRVGLTCDELEQALGLKHQTCSSTLRVMEQAQPPIVEKTSARRRTRGGRKAIVYRAIPGRRP